MPLDWPGEPHVETIHCVTVGRVAYSTEVCALRAAKLTFVALETLAAPQDTVTRSNSVGERWQSADGVVMKTALRYQNGFLYEHHGAWYVRYYQRTSKEDGTCQLSHASKHLGRCKDFRNISDVELCRALFM